MKKTTTLAGLLAGLLALGALFAGASLAQPLARGSSCKVGKESTGCRLTFGGYITRTGGLVLGFIPANAPKSARTSFSVSSTFVCHTTIETQLLFKTRQIPKVGATISFSGAGTLAGSGQSSSEVKSTRISAQIRLTNAKQAHLSGHVEMTLANGAKCSKPLAGKMLRVLGG